jgi:hypothetical protein
MKDRILCAASFCTRAAPRSKYRGDGCPTGWRPLVYLMDRPYRRTLLHVDVVPFGAPAFLCRACGAVQDEILADLGVAP